MVCFVNRLSDVFIWIWQVLMCPIILIRSGKWLIVKNNGFYLGALGFWNVLCIRQDLGNIPLFFTFDRFSVEQIITIMKVMTKIVKVCFYGMRMDMRLVYTHIYLKTNWLKLPKILKKFFRVVILLLQVWTKRTIQNMGWTL